MCAGAPGGWKTKLTLMVKQILKQIGAFLFFYVCLFNTKTDRNDVTYCSGSVN